MALSVVQTANNAATGTSCTATFGAGCSANNLMVGLYFTKSDTGWVNPSGWTTAGSVHNSTNADDLVIAYKIAVGGETGITFSNNGTSDHCGLVIYEISGNDTSTPLDKVGPGTAFSTGQTSVSSSSTGTLSIANEICIGTAGIRNVTISGITVNNSFLPSPPDTATDAQIYSLGAHIIVSATTAQSCTFSWTTAADPMGLIASFKQASAGGFNAGFAYGATKTVGGVF